MNNKFLRTLCIALGCITITSCSSTEAKMPAQTQPASADNQIVFKVNGEQVQTTGWNISRFNMGKGIQLNITSNMHREKRTIAFNINGWAPGTYELQPFASEGGTAYGDYKPDYEKMLNSYPFTDGEITIEGIDTTAALLNATFHGTAKSMHGAFSITDGKIINGKLTSGTINY